MNVPLGSLARMTADESRAVFVAQSANVSALLNARTRLKRSLNSHLLAGDEANLKLYTAFYALLFSAWAEANFHKLVFTPHGLDLNEIDLVQAEARKSIEQAWLKCLEIALPKVYGHNNTSFLPNARQTLRRLIQDNIVRPYQIRNKFAHGQWVVATTSDYTKIHPEITQRLLNLSYVDVDRWFETQRRVSHLMEMLIASPKRTFTRKYWEIVTDIEEKIQEMSAWNLEERQKALRGKVPRHQVGS